MYEKYESPLSSRYASEEMLKLFSHRTRIETWRKLWTELARAEHDLGLPITAEQVAALEAKIQDIDFDLAAKREKEVRHDVMAHVYAYGAAAPEAAGIIHLGATSCYVTDNADLILYRKALELIRGALLQTAANLAAFAETHRATPTLGYTHYQPAQPVTVGKRATLWMQDLLSDVEELDQVLGCIRFLGCRGATGTEASLLDLFEGNGEQVDELNRRLAAASALTPALPSAGRPTPGSWTAGFSTSFPPWRRAAAGWQRTSGFCSMTASWKSPLRAVRSAPPPCPTSETPCAASAFAL